MFKNLPRLIDTAPWDSYYGEGIYVRPIIVKGFSYTENFKQIIKVK